MMTSEHDKDVHIMPMRRQTANNFFLGTSRRRNSSPFIARRNFQQTSAVDGISRLIGEAQQSIALVQQLTPLLDQFRQLSPIITNLPLLIKLMGSMNNTSDETSSTQITSNETSSRQTDSNEASSTQIRSNETADIVVEETRNGMTVEEKNEFVKKEVSRILKEIGIEEH